MVVRADLLVVDCDRFSSHIVYCSFGAFSTAFSYSSSLVLNNLLLRETITSEEGDKKEEEEYLNRALRWCGYPSWALKQVTENKKKNATDNKKDKNNKSQVVIPCVEGVSERVHRILTKYGVTTAMRSPHNTETYVGTHKVEPEEQCELVQIPNAGEELWCSIYRRDR